MPDNSLPPEDAPEGIAPPPLLARPSRAESSKVALKKRAPVPGRTAGTVTQSAPAVVPEKLDVATNGFNTETSEPAHVPAEAVAPEQPEIEQVITVADPEVSKPLPVSDTQEQAAIAVTESATPALEPTPKRGFWGTLTNLRTKWGWVLGVAALGLAVWGERIAEAERLQGLLTPSLITWILFGLAGFLFVLGIAPTPNTPAHPTTQFIKGVKSLPVGRRIVFLVMLFGGIAAAIAAAPLFISLSAKPDTDQGWWANTGSWILYVVALLLFGGSWVVWEFRRPDAMPIEPKTAEAIAAAKSKSIHPALSAGIMLGVFVLAAVIRFTNLSNVPTGLWFDEAQNGIVGRELLAPNVIHPAYISAFTQMGALYFYLYGFVVKLFGETLIWPLRFLPALAGSLIAPMLYLIGYRLFNWRVGLAAGVLVAVAAWNITMSRFGMASLPTVAVDVAAYLCLVQGLRTGRLGWYAGAGVLLGLALQMYYPAQLIPIILTLVLVHRLIFGRMRFFRAVRAGIVAFVVGALIAVIPIATFAAQHSSEFTERAQTISIFSPMGSEGRPDALQVSIQRHVLMFNFHGDGNPRHNMPGEPMLDWIMAALFLAGVAVCALRAWRWQYFFALVWLLVNMSGGILSVVFEAPQGHRTLENSVVTSLIAAIFVGELWTALDARAQAVFRFLKARTSKSREQSPSNERTAGLGFRPSTLTFAAPVLLLLIWIGSINIDRYFNRQANDMSVWLEMGGTNKLMGLAMAQYGNDYTVYISPDHAGVPALRYLAPNLNSLVWPGGYVLPFTGNNNVALLFAPNDEANVYAVKRIYPNAQVEVGYGPNRDSPQLFKIIVTADDINSVRGVQKIDSAHAASSLKIEQQNTYAFSWQGAGAPPKLTIDGGEVAMQQAVTLALGLHSVELAGDGADFANLLMSVGGSPPTPVPSVLLFDPRKVDPRGLTAYLRSGDVFDGPAQITRVDPQISFYFHEIPMGRPYTVDWIGKLYAPVAGNYGFTTEQLSTSRLAIDGKEVLVNGTPNLVASTRVDLTAGLHDFRLKFEDLAGASHMYLYWTPPGADPNEKYIIPASFLLPEMGTYPALPASGKWPSLDEADDTLFNRIGQPLRTAGAPPPSPTDSSGQSQPTPVPPPNAIPAAVTITGGASDSLPRPRAAAVDKDGNVYVYTEIDSKIRKFDSKGNPLLKWDAVNAQGAPSTEGAALIVYDDKLLFLEASNAEVITYNLDGTEQSRVHICDCFAPRGMALSRDGNLWVTNTGFNQVYKVSFAGLKISSIGDKGTGPGQFVEPSSVWESPKGYLFVTDAGNKRVQSFTPDGQPLAQWPMGESTARDGNRLTGTSDGNALLTQYDSRSIIEYSPEGTEKSRFQFAPQGVALIPAGIQQAGPNKYIVLFQFDNLAGIFDLEK